MPTRSPYAALIAACLCAASCAVVGPNAIRNGRAHYNEAIIATNSQQVLSMIVRLRYGEPHGLLAVSSVTANVSLQSSTTAQFGIGPDTNFVGNLVPLSTGVLYEENPTISYSPISGESYLIQLLSPLPLDLTMLLIAGSEASPEVLSLLLRSMNHLQNPGFLEDPGSAVDPRLERVGELFASLTRRGWLTWIEDEGEPPTFALMLRGEGDEYAAQVRELYALLGLHPPEALDQVIIQRVALGVQARGEEVVRLRTRSVYELFKMAAASVEVPERDLESGLARRLPPRGASADSIRIRRADSAPPEALVAVEHHGSWYYIDATDSVSKETFTLLESILAVRIAESVDSSSSAPVLTVPVSR